MTDNTDRTLVLTGLVCLFLLLLHFLPTITVGGVALRRVSILSDLSPHPAEQGASPLLPQPKAPQLAQNAPKNFKEHWPKGTEPITDYAAGAEGSMDHFYAMLDSLQQHKLNSRPLRIAFFTDSYAEGDILTADLREKLQARFGGQGVGWIDTANDVNKFRLSLNASDHGFTEHMAMQKNGYDASRAGLSGRYAPFGTGATQSFSAYKQYPHAAQWQQVHLFLTPNGTVQLTATANNADQVQTLSSAGVGEAVFQLSQPTKETSLRFSGSGTAYGTSLEGTTGIVLDNFSMRSSTGLPLGQIPDATLRQFQQLRHYDLVIIAFGGNAATPASRIEETQRYAKDMTRVIEKFKQCFSPASVLLFSSPDMGVRENGQIVTPESVINLVAYQKQMAADARVPFFDLFHALGGRGTVARLHEQGIIGDDLFHINKRGGALVADHIFQTLMAGLSNHQRKMKALQD